MPAVRTVQGRLKTILPILNSNYILLHLASPSLRDVHSLVLNLPLINYASSIRISVVELVEVVEVVVCRITCWLSKSAVMTFAKEVSAKRVMRILVVVVVVVVTVVWWQQQYIAAVEANAMYICPIIQDMEGR